MIRLLITLLVIAFAVTACGTRGDLECPKGTAPRVDGTCRAPA
jgi:predicted small lipoprotein YifL